MPVGELLARTSSRELTEWMAFEQMDGPLGSKRGDYQAALVAKTVADVNRPKRRAAYKLKDFLLRFDQDEQRQTPQQIAAILRRWIGR